MDFSANLCVYCPQAAIVRCLRPQKPWFVRCEFSSRPRLEPIPPQSRTRAARNGLRASALFRSARNALFTAVLTTLSPTRCHLCEQWIAEPTLSTVCRNCWRTIRSTPHADFTCSCCGASLLTDAPSPYLIPADELPVLDKCYACQKFPQPFVRVASFATYSGKLRLAVHALKYYGIRPLARPLGALLAQAIQTLAPDAPRQMLVIPVPLHPRRLRARGFNQARLLAGSALRNLRRTDPDWQLTLSPASLVRQRETAPQVTLGVEERRLNLELAFHVARPAQVRDRAILLIDDIVTTGSTARACARALLDAGAASVFVASLARAQMVRRDGQLIPGDADDRAFADRSADSTADFSATPVASPHPT